MELMVVIGIIILIAAIAVPAMGPMMKSNHSAQVVNTLSGLLITAQTQAAAQGNPVGLRIERAYRTVQQTIPSDPNGHLYECMATVPGDATTAQSLDYQQIRLVSRSSYQPEGAQNYDLFAVKPLAGFKPVALPKDTWLAPDYVTALPVDAFNGTYQPRDAWSGVNKGTRYSRIETFFVMFNETGELVKLPAPDPPNSIVGIQYADPMQLELDTGQNPAKVVPVVTGHPDPSARALLMYDREPYEATTQGGSPPGTDSKSFLQSSARPLLINRVMGSVAEVVP